MRVEHYDTFDDPDGTITWRYRVIFPTGVPWRIQVVRTGHAYSWSLTDDPKMLEQNRLQPVASHQEALEAAIRCANDLETGMW